MPKLIRKNIKICVSFLDYVFQCNFSIYLKGKQTHVDGIFDGRFHDCCSVLCNALDLHPTYQGSQLLGTFINHVDIISES